MFRVLDRSDLKSMPSKNGCIFSLRILCPEFGAPKRWEGSICRSLSIKSLAIGSRSGGHSILRPKTAGNTCTSLMPGNATFPVHILYTIHPSAHKSLQHDDSLSWIISGAMKLTVPTNVPRRSSFPCRISLNMFSAVASSCDLTSGASSSVKSDSFFASPKSIYTVV